MSVITSFEVCQTSDCSTLVFSETTGAYSINNLNGYGNPNEDTSGATAVLNITLYNGDIYSLDLTSSGFPTTDKTKTFTINSTDLGYASGDPIDDQVISFEYVVTTSLSTIIKQYKEQAFYCKVQCCVNSMFLSIDYDCDECARNSLKIANKAYLMLYGLKSTANCGDKTTFNKILKQLNKICSNSSCSNC